MVPVPSPWFHTAYHARMKLLPLGAPVTLSSIKQGFLVTHYCVRLSLTVAIETAGSRGGDHVRQPSTFRSTHAQLPFARHATLTRSCQVDLSPQGRVPIRR